MGFLHGSLCVVKHYTRPFNRLRQRIHTVWDQVYLAWLNSPWPIYWNLHIHRWWFRVAVISICLLAVFSITAHSEQRQPPLAPDHQLEFVEWEAREQLQMLYIHLWELLHQLQYAEGELYERVLEEIHIKQQEIQQQISLIVSLHQQHHR